MRETHFASPVQSFICSQLVLLSSVCVLLCVRARRHRHIMFAHGTCTCAFTFTPSPWLDTKVETAWREGIVLVEMFFVFVFLQRGEDVAFLTLSVRCELLFWVFSFGVYLCRVCTAPMQWYYYLHKAGLSLGQSCKSANCVWSVAVANRAQELNSVQEVIRCDWIFLILQSFKMRERECFPRLSVWDECVGQLVWSLWNFICCQRTRTHLDSHVKCVRYCKNTGIILLIGLIWH